MVKNNMFAIKGKRFLLSLILSTLLFVSLIKIFPIFISASNNSEEEIKSIIEDAVNAINYSMIRRHIDYFAHLKSRVTGYPGFYEASNYIISKFKEFGLTVIVQKYNITVPIDSGSWIKTKYGENISAYSLWPNGPQACATTLEGIKGKILYVGRGDLSNFNGFDVEGAIILMDFNSEDNWLNAVRLGAKAIVFIEPEHTNSLEALKKAIPVPINVPRLFVKKEDGYVLMKLASNNEEVTIYSGMKWKEVTVYNIVGCVNGSKYSNEIIVISSHYDSWSIVPAISPGAEDSLGISILLEIARYFGKNPPLRSVWLVGFSGFYQCIAGPTEWAEHVFFSKEVQLGEKSILLHMDLDLSTDSDKIDILYTGPPVGSGTGSAYWFGDITEIANRYVPVQSSIQKYLSYINAQEFVRYNLASMRWGTQQAIGGSIWSYQLATQPAVRVGLIGFTMRTQYANRWTFFTPLNDVDSINWNNLRAQVKVIVATIAGFANERDWRIPYLIPGRVLWGYAGLRIAAGAVFGFVTLNGTVAEYDVRKGWYTPLEGALVRIYYGGSPSSDPNAYLTWPFNSRYTFSKENGTFTFHGLAPYLTHGLDAWKFDENDGSIIYAVDEGIYGTASGLAGGITTSVYPISHPTSVLIPVFRCTEVTLFDLFDPRLMRRSAVPFSSFPSILGVYDQITKAYPVFYGRYFAPYYGLGMVFVKPGAEIIVAFTPHSVELRKPLILLTNSSEENTEGYGYTITKPLVIYKTSLEASEDLYYLSIGRYRILSSRNIRNRGVEELINRGYSCLMKAKDYFANRTYDKGYAYSLVALALLSKAYESGVMPLFNDVSNFVLFFVFTSIFSSVFLERLIFRSEGLRKIAGIAAVMSVVLILLGFVTPVFEVMQNLVMAIFGVGMLLMTMLIGIIILKSGSSLMERTATEIMGRHVVRRDETSLLVHLLGVSVDNMRRRPLTTILVILTLTIFVASQTAFTSASQIIAVQESSLYSEKPLYDGVLLKRQYGFPPEHRGINLDIVAVSALEAFANNSFYISPRVWLYPTAIYPYGVSVEIVNPKGKSTIISPVVLLGLSTEESNLLFDGWVIEGIPRLDVLHSCIISKSMASLLNVTLGDRIFVKSICMNLTVVAIVDDAFETTDFDVQTPILPASPYSSSLFARESVGMNENLPPQWMSINNVIIVPWKLAYNLGGFISSIVLLPAHEMSLEELREIGRQIALSVDLSVYVHHKTVTIGLSRVTSYSIGGWNIMWILLAIIVISTVNVLIGGLQQRRKEIYVYSSLGLSPTNAALMFISESLAYAAITVTIGYLLGYCLNTIFIMVFPESFAFNTTSIFVIISLAAIFIACLSASIYPSIVAAKIITPSLERKWRPVTKPVGDVWTLPLPIRIVEEEEVLALLAFLSEYYGGAGAIKPNFMVHYVSPIHRESLSLSLSVSLLPTELGINQKVTFKGIPQKDKNYAFHVSIERASGSYDSWLSRNYYFVDDLRKQIMLWKTLPIQEKRKYFEIAKSLHNVPT